MARLSARSASSAWLMARLASPIARVGAAASFAAAAVRRRCQLIRRHDLVDQPGRLRLGRPERLAAEDQCRGTMAPQARTRVRVDAGVRHQADPSEGQDEARVLGGVDEVAGQRQRHARAGGHAVDRGDHRLRQLADGGHQRVVLIGQDATEVSLAAAPPRRSAPAAEASTLPGDHHRPDRVVAPRRLDGRSSSRRMAAFSALRRVRAG